MNEVSNSMKERPYANGVFWFILLLGVLFFFSFYSIAIRTNYVPNHMQIEAGGITQSVMVVSPIQK